MQIDRHNYEAFFILYMDNELSVEERRAVEAFVQENPDLNAELDLLMQSQLIPDDSLVFSGKDSLFKQEGQGLISTSNYEEKLLSYLDNELTASEQKEVKDFIAKHPSVEKEFSQLQKTKLVPDSSVVFANKEILYREEEKVRVIGFNWKRIAIAAGLLLAVGTAALMLTKDRDEVTGPGTVAETTTLPAKKNVLATQEQPAIITQDPNERDVASETTSSSNSSSSIDIAIKEKTALPVVIERKSERILNVTPPESEAVLATTQEKSATNNLPQPLNNPYVNNKIADNPIAMTTPVIEEPLTNNKETITRPTVTPHSTQPLDHVITAALTEPVDEEQPGRKNKLRGFFRKVTRTFEKTTNIKATDDEDRLLLGGLAIKL